MQQSKRVWSSLAAMLVVGAGFVSIGCDKSPNEITIGVIHSKTGIYAAFGAGGSFGVQAAVEDLNKQGGLEVGGKKVPVKIVLVDAESDPAKAAAITEKLINQDHVNFIVTGDELPQMHAGVSDVAEKYKVPYVTSVGPMEPWLAMRMETKSRWQYTWATGDFAIVTPTPAGDFRAGKPGYTVMDTWIGTLDAHAAQTNKQMAVCAMDDPDGKGWYTLFGPALQKIGYEVVGVEDGLGLKPMGPNLDFSKEIAAWKSAGVEILWGNGPGPFVGALLKQCADQGFHPKIVSISRGSVFYDDIKGWPNDAPLGVGQESCWSPSLKDAPGIGGATPEALAARWQAATKQPLNPIIGTGYRSVQVLADAVKRAGSVEGEKVNAALAQTDIKTIAGRVKFDANHFNRIPLMFTQWFKADNADKWESKVVFSKHDTVPATGKDIFPIPASK